MAICVTLIPPSNRPFLQTAISALRASQRLYSNGRILVSAPKKPGPDWHRISVRVKEAA